VNLGQLRTQIQDHGYSADTVAQQNDYINAAYREIHGSMRWPFLEAVSLNAQATSVGTQAYTPPMTNWRNIDAIRIAQPNIANFISIEYMDPQQLFDMSWVNPTETATPRYWTMYAQQIWFFPIPDDVYEISYFYCIEPADLAADNDVPVIPLAYHDVLVSGAICRMAFRQRDWIGLELWTSKYAQDMTRFKEEYLIRQRQTSSRVKESGYWNTEINYPLTSTGF
jgi:hypothetical protein